MHVDELAGRSTLREMVCWRELVGWLRPSSFCIASRSFNFELGTGHTHARAGGGPGARPAPRRARRPSYRPPPHPPPGRTAAESSFSRAGGRRAARGVLHNTLLRVLQYTALSRAHSSYSTQHRQRHLMASIPLLPPIL